MSNSKIVSGETRPWGSWKIVDTNPVTKIIEVNPGGMLSLQSHKNRSETWIPEGSGLICYSESPIFQSEGLLDSAKVDLTGWTSDARLMLANNVYRVPAGTKHRLINPTERTIKVIEIIEGLYNEEDIIRYQDIYQR